MFRGPRRKNPMVHVYLYFDSCMLKDSVMKNIQNLIKNKPVEKGDVVQQLLDLKEWSQNPERYERRLNFRGAGLVQPGPEGVRQGYARPGGNPAFGTEITGAIHKGKIQPKNQEKYPHFLKESFQ